LFIYWNLLYLAQQNINTMSHINVSLRRIVSARRFLQLVQNERGAIESSKFIPPRLGSNGLGKFLVTYKYEPKNAPIKQPAEKQSGAASPGSCGRIPVSC
jgi:hypothetical protein